MSTSIHATDKQAYKSKQSKKHEITESEHCTQSLSVCHDSSNSGCDSLPCLNSNISIKGGRNRLPKLSTQHRKTAFILQSSVANLAIKFGVENLGFLTLTFADHVLEPKEAQRRLNSLITNVIKPRYSDYLGVFERQKSGRIHYHMLVVLGFDARTGVNFGELADGNYSSVGHRLRQEWKFWRSASKSYGFGRTELLPVKTTIEAMAKYVGKYISKHIEARKDEDKGVRLVRYSKTARTGTTRFMFVSEGSSQWRLKVRIFAEMMESSLQSINPDITITSLSDLSNHLGSRWAYHHRETILNMPTIQI